MRRSYTGVKKKFRFKDEFEQWSLPPAETMFHEEPFEVSKLLKQSLPGTRNNACARMKKSFFPGPQMRHARIHTYKASIVGKPVLHTSERYRDQMELMDHAEAGSVRTHFISNTFSMARHPISNTSGAPIVTS